MIDHRLHRQLAKVAGRVRQVRVMTLLAVVWWLAAALGGALLLWGRVATWDYRLAAAATGAIATIGAVVLAALGVRATRDPRVHARQVEAAFPELASSLLTAVELVPTLPGGRYGFLQERVIQQSLEHAYDHRWERIVPVGRLLAAHAVHAGGLVMCIAVLGNLAAVRTEIPVGTEAAASPLVTAPPAGPLVATIEPGNTEVEVGTNLLVLARFLSALPAEVVLQYQPAGGDSQSLNMSKSLDDPVFGTRIRDVRSPLTYRVSFAGQRSETYTVSVFEYPALLRADAQLVFPSYASLPDKRLEDVRVISAVEGTQVDLQCQLNKSVKEALLVDRDGTTLSLTPDASGPNRYSVRWTLDKPRRWELRMKDDAGRANKTRYEIAVKVLPNQPPDLKLVMPARDVQASPLEEVELAASARDDFGLERIGVSYQNADGQAEEVVLGKKLPGRRIEVRHLLALEALQVRPDDLVSYHFWAEDIDPRGKLRRALSDMFFVEVRPFEEVFRQGEQPAPGESQQSQEAGEQPGNQGEQLTELQKQIINGTWKVIRRETAMPPTSEYAADVVLLSESQSKALEQVTILEEKLENPDALRELEEARKSMEKAVEQLNAAKEKSDLQALPLALQAEQNAYRSLLRMRSREHQVVRSNQRSSSSSQSSSRSQQQLQQLELKNDVNRYETERTAKSNDDTQRQETRQVLNRLRELARRQSDVNERLKELQSALQEAKGEQQRAELERQLQRLREQQQELLRDTDELLSRMEQPENSERMSENRQELEQARDQVRQASESLEEGQVSRAIASGSRAQQELEQVRDSMNQASASQFSEQMRELSRAANELDERERELGEEIAERMRPNSNNRSLRDTKDPGELPEQVASQRARLDQLLESMRGTVLEAEQPEPLLAEKLHEAFRQAEQQKPGRSLESAQQSLEQGLVEDAAREERVAAEGVRQLREGVQRAAESVLGDETEALRRAREMVQELSRQLQEERSLALSAEDATRAKDGEPGTTQAAKGREQPAGPSKQESGQRGGAPGENGNRPGTKSAPKESAAAGRPGQSPGPAAGGERLGGLDQLAMDRTAGDGRPAAPLTGDDFVEWSDRLRDVEEIISDPRLRADAARIRERARDLRRDLKRRSATPDWGLVDLELTHPLNELRDRLHEEVLRRTPSQTLVPVDRDPVPPRYQEQVRRYYEELGKGR